VKFSPRFFFRYLPPPIEEWVYPLEKAYLYRWLFEWLDRDLGFGAVRFQ
jgi:hypothetical protein